MSKKEQYQADLTVKRERLNLYYEQEKKMLTGGVQSYGVGSRNLARYNTELAQVRAAIKQLEEEIKELDSLINGERSRKCVQVIPRF